MIMIAVLDEPIAPANSVVIPPPPIHPNLISGAPKLAFVEAIRMSHPKAISNPPPSAHPLIAAIAGFLRDRIASQ